jgi:hypothetical protein
MRSLILLVLLAATGCSTDETSGKPPAEVPTPISLNTLGNEIDKGDSRVASSVTVMIENSDKPKVVKNEGSVALALLPKPESDDLAAARARVTAGDDKAYEAEVAKSKAWLSKVEADWNAAVQQSKKNADDLVQARNDLTKANQQMDELKTQLDKADRNLWTMAAVGLFVVGVLTGSIFGWRIGGSILACAPLAAAVPVIITSEYFAWIIGVTITIAACLLLWRLFDYIKDKNNEQPPRSD